MKKIMILIILAALTLSVCSCGVDSGVDGNSINNEADRNSVSASDSEENDVKSDKTFLISFSEGVSPDTFKNFADSAEFGLNTALERTQLTDVAATKKHPMDAQKTLNYSYSKVISQDSAAIEEGTFFSAYDFYVLDDEKIAFLHDSDTVCFYTRPYNPDEGYPIMSEERVKEIAEDFLLTVISEPLFSNFEYEGMSTDILGRYALLYKRYVCGYPTDETISIWIDRSGEISGYNGYNVSKYNTLITDISATAIELSADVLLSELKSLELTGFTSAQPELTTNSDGVVFVSIKFSYESGGISIGAIAYSQID
ncbi:MAG: hypothetical protein IIW63_08560 [Clostridia bacterium]|nr:hypothetical protein [Clostridia bacterium]